MKDGLRVIQIAVPFLPAEIGKLNQFLRRFGMKKGAFARTAILERLDREEKRRASA